jgi:hypothetical protein
MTTGNYEATRPASPVADAGKGSGEEKGEKA